MTRRELLARGTRTLEDAGIENAAFDALQLLLFTLNVDRTAYLLTRDEEAAPEQSAAFERLIARRAAREPLQYLLGSAYFLGRPFSVGEGVLIPRPETEELAQCCIRIIAQKRCRTVYDLCAGSGCIGISIALACPGTDVYLFEKYDAALAFLKRNIPPAAADRIHPVRADILTFDPAGLPSPDLIVSNPPYISSGELNTLQPEVRLEPATALDGGTDGLMFYRAIRDRWLPLLNENGFAAFECGDTQADALLSLFRTAGSVQASRDTYGNYRFITIDF